MFVTLVLLYNAETSPFFFGEGQKFKKKSYRSLRWLLNTVQCIKILKQTHQTPINNLYHFEEFIIVTLQKR